MGWNAIIGCSGLHVLDDFVFMEHEPALRLHEIPVSKFFVRMQRASFPFHAAAHAAQLYE